MARDFQLKCIDCGKQETFIDQKQSSQDGWYIFGWKVESNTPYVRCPDCIAGKKEPEPEKKKRGRPKK